jgi:transcriptional regulator with XRE-family HTH domain
MTTFPNRLRELRKAKKLKLEQVAEAIGCSVMHVSDLERGNKTLSMDWMRRFARFYEVTPGDLLLPQDNSGFMTEDERALLALYRAADDDRKAQIRQMAEIIAPAARVAA